MNFINLETIEKTLTYRHPHDWVSSMSSASLKRPRTRPAELSGIGRIAAVMLLMFPDAEGQTQTVLTRRRDTLKHHPGQISLPGGRQEPGEPLAETAVREVEEEIGVAREQIQILGELNPLYVPPSDFTITPFVGWVDDEPTFRLQASEVAELIQVPIGHFCDPATRQFSAVDNDTQDREVPWFSSGGRQIWGATAIILDDFVQRFLAT